MISQHHAATEGTSELVAYIGTATRLPVTLKGGSIVVAWAATGSFVL